MALPDHADFALTLDDSSPTIFYAPFADTFGLPNLAAGWNPYYTVSGFATDPGPLSSGSGVSDIGNGTSLHVTACNGCRFAIKWNGTAIALYGTITAPSSSPLTYSVSLDGTSTTNYISSISASPSVGTAATDVLARFSNLTIGEHEFVFTVLNPGISNNTDSNDLDAIVAFDRAVVYMDGSGSQPTPSTSSQPSSPTETLTTFVVPDNSVSFRGQWSYSPGLLPDLPDAAFHTSVSVGDTAHVEFNGTAVSLAGLTTPSSGDYNITLDGLQYPLLSARSSFTTALPTVLFYAAGLDPTVMHTLQITNSASPQDDGGGSYLAVLVGGINVTTVTVFDGPSATPVGATSTSTTSSRLPRGTIAALAIGVTLALIALISLIIAVVLCRRRAAQRKRDLIVNPRLTYWQRNWRRWFGRSAARAPGVDEPYLDAEKDAVWYEDRAQYQERQILDVSRRPDRQEKDIEEVDRDTGKAVARPRHASQNSDGSFSIDLPELSSGPLQYPPASFPSTPQPLSLISQISSAPRVTSSSTSPRSPRPRGPRDMHGRNGSQGILLSQMTGPDSGADEDEGEGLPSLRVEFAHQEERPERRAERYLSTGGLSLPQSLKQALSRNRDVDRGDDAPVAGPSRPSTVFSFLDLTSSASASSSSGRAHSNRKSGSHSRSSSTRSRQTGSCRNTGSERSVNSIPPERRMSLALSMTIGGGPTASRPSLTPDISLQAVPLPPPITMPESAHPRDVSDADRMPPDVAGMLPSPTDSIPLTVSDIHFRHSVHSSASQGSESRRTSAIRSSGSHRLPHPPLPGASQSPPGSPTTATHTRDNPQVVRSHIVQKLMGLEPAGSVPPSPAASGDPRAGRPMTAEGPSTANAPAASTSGHGQRTGSFSFGLGRHR